MSVGPTEILLIALVALLLFGAGRLPEIGKSIGAGLRDFKRGLDGGRPKQDERDQPRTPDDRPRR
jgi:sec-independent protein translocase protein TatA